MNAALIELSENNMKSNKQFLNTNKIQQNLWWLKKQEQMRENTR